MGRDVGGGGGGRRDRNDSVVVRRWGMIRLRKGPPVGSAVLNMMDEGGAFGGWSSVWRVVKSVQRPCTLAMLEDNINAGHKWRWRITTTFDEDARCRMTPPLGSINAGR